MQGSSHLEFGADLSEDEEGLEHSKRPRKQLHNEHERIAPVPEHRI